MGDLLSALSDRSIEDYLQRKILEQAKQLEEARLEIMRLGAVVRLLRDENAALKRQRPWLGE